MNATESLDRHEDRDVAFFGAVWVMPAAKQIGPKIQLIHEQARNATREQFANTLRRLWENAITRNALIAACFLAVVIALTTLIWLLHPVWLMDAVLAIESLSLTFHGLTIPLKYLLFIGLFQRTRRVSDAWVRRHVSKARRAFSEHPTVRDRALHVYMPLRIDERLVGIPAPEDFRRVFVGPRSTLLIIGEGGSGKTSLACQLGRMAMASVVSERLQKHLMIPILIEDDFKQDSRLKRANDASVTFDSGSARDVLKDDNDRLIDTVSGKLASLIGSEEELPRSLIVQLMRQRRILLIVDHFSEFSKDSWSVITPDRSGFPAAAMIVTSRQTERQLDSHLTTVRPLRVGRKRLIGFVDAYLDLSGARQWFDVESGEDELDLAQRLKAVVAQREVTILIARMFLAAEIARVKGENANRQPTSVPELMLHHLSWLNRNTDDHPVSDPKLLATAKRVGWHCLKDNLRPSNVPLKELQDDGQLGMEHLSRLQQLGVLVHTNLLMDEVRFSLDPVSEYLAALHFIDSFQADAAKWETLIKCIDQMSEGETTIDGFASAMYDCAYHSRGSVPARIVADLGIRTSASESAKVTNAPADKAVA